MTWGQLKYLVKADLYRYTGDVSWILFLRYARTNPGFQYTFWMRLCCYYHENRKGISHRILFFLARRILTKCRYKYGIDIPYTASIGAGLYIGHFNGIFINSEAVLGRNLNLSQGVTIGQSSRGERAGTPTVGDNVYIGPGAKIIGSVRIGSHAAIGANCVVTKDIPDNAVVVGIPGRVISLKGSEGYILNGDGEHKLRQVGNP